MAPGYDDDALETLLTKRALRILSDTERRSDPPERARLQAGARRAARAGARQHIGGSRGDDGRRRARSTSGWADLLFAWSVCRHVSSNAIVLARDGQTIGIGAGQMSRVDAVRIALENARRHGHSLEGAVLASDAFFPFPDGPQLALEAGITALIQPGGSRRDAEVVAAVAEAGGAMVLTGRRHFRH